ncbi:MAG: hypothetical protein KF802_16495 [Bdellovibrionaceae bacterium]|jgi:hypothetical protein|nr:hypothetical protein [Pseudobdellovibrionaceae bacterium]
MSNLPTLEEMLLALDAKGLEAQEAWQRVATLIHSAMQREADAIKAAQLALQDGSRLREKLMATFAVAEKELTETAEMQPSAVANG